MSNLCMTSRIWAAKNESCFIGAILTASKMILQVAQKLYILKSAIIWYNFMVC